MQSLPQPLSLISIAACQASVRLGLFTLIPWQASQRLSMARYATGTATEIQPQQDLNPAPPSR